MCVRCCAVQRSAEDHTAKYPDVVLTVANVLKGEGSGVDYILDAEVVAYDAENKRILPFQQLQTRARKDVLVSDVKVTVCVFAFDLLYFRGKSFLEETLIERRKVLHASFETVDSKFAFAEGRDLSSPDDIMEFLNESVKEGGEGLMVKVLDGPSSTYEPANRSQNWLKVKKDYLEGMTDSLDLVPIGAYYGRGKRAGVFGAFLLACYNPDTEEYGVRQYLPRRIMTHITSPSTPGRIAPVLSLHVLCFGSDLHVQKNKKVDLQDRNRLFRRDPDVHQRVLSSGK